MDPISYLSFARLIRLHQKRTRPREQRAEILLHCGVTDPSTWSRTFFSAFSSSDLFPTSFSFLSFLWWFYSFRASWRYSWHRTLCWVWGGQSVDLIYIHRTYITDVLINTLHIYCKMIATSHQLTLQSHHTMTVQSWPWTTWELGHWASMPLTIWM